jgi:hypothetical protein
VEATGDEEDRTTKFHGRSSYHEHYLPPRHCRPENPRKSWKKS